MATIELKKSEVRGIEALLQDGTGAALSLTGATVRFQARTASAGTLKINGVATVVDSGTARVRYTTTAADTDTPGDYLAEWRIQYAGGDQVVPESGYWTLRVWEDLA